MGSQVNAIMFCVSLACFIAWFYGPWQTLCIDWARQRMFESRNAIFDLAYECGAERGFGFESLEYRKLRSQIETLIRFSHHVSWPRLAIFALTRRLMSVTPPHIEGFREVLAEIKDKQIHDAVAKHIDVVHREILFLLLQRSLIVLLFWCLAKGLEFFCSPITRTCRNYTDALYRVIQSDAETLEYRAVRFAVRPHGQRRLRA